jgi:heme/copper-type cytochrome/quinol oxidase subunit 3
MKDFIFYLGMGALFTHEIDAMQNHEWRVLPILRMLPDELGMAVFVVAHVPIFAILISLVASANVRVRSRSRFFISGFLVLHGLLHALFVNHPNYEFSSVLSNTLIFGGAVFGAIYLGLEFMSRKDAAT